MRLTLVSRQGLQEDPPGGTLTGSTGTHHHQTVAERSDLGAGVNQPNLTIPGFLIINRRYTRLLAMITHVITRGEFGKKVL